jgi:putative ABC transport system substrate-binding protein
LRHVENLQPQAMECGIRAKPMLLPPEPLIRSQRVAIGASAKTQGLVLAVVGGGVYLPEGGLISYGPTLAQYAELSARYVDRLLKGAKPGDLPVEQPSRFELAINLKTAQALGLSIPESMLQRADFVLR